MNNLNYQKTNIYKLQEEIKQKIFLPSHNPIGYYVSAYAKFRLDALFRKGQIDSQYSNFRYHLLYIFRVQTSGISMPDISTNRFKNYCEKMEEILWNPSDCKDAFLKASEIIDKAVNGNYDRALAKTVAFLKQIKSLTEL
ncbi:hypothetical protein [Brunnivagina elsteri]|uniref:hypothetical protein n=1 Tax=Brunnivagina elsteri TaxID=1247191 RepID=UPI001177BE74|nr:hypothetical protein [Calothrix elsteri]